MQDGVSILDIKNEQPKLLFIILVVTIRIL